MSLAVTAIFQNEAPYLKEWIEFHLSVGVESFYLFDHMSTDSPREVLGSYIERGVVQLVSWPLTYENVYEWTGVQCLAYDRAIHWARGRVKWLAILDTDEFLFSTEGRLLDVLNRYEDCGGVAVNWQIFGTSNVPKIPEGKSMIESLIMKLPKDHEDNLQFKSIVRPERVKMCPNPHAMIYYPGFEQVDCQGAAFEGSLTLKVEVEPIRINHYTLRDEWFLRNRKIPRLQKWWGNSIDWEAKYQKMNAVQDQTILNFSPQKTD